LHNVYVLVCIGVLAGITPTLRRCVARIVHEVLAISREGSEQTADHKHMCMDVISYRELLHSPHFPERDEKHNCCQPLQQYRKVADYCSVVECAEVQMRKVMALGFDGNFYGFTCKPSTGSEKTQNESKLRIHAQSCLSQFEFGCRRINIWTQAREA
jgi:hypothetical protein